MRNLTRTSLQRLRRRLRHIPELHRPFAEQIIDSEQILLDRFQALLRSKIDAGRIRTHGDLHLGQILWTGKDFVFIDFEGEPARPVGERRIKRSPLRDVAGMIRSFDYAAQAGLAALEERGMVAEHEAAHLSGWARSWARGVSSRYLRGYLHHVAPAELLPADDDEVALLLDAFIIEKALYELGYELDSRPDWVGIPILGMLEVLEA